MSLFKKKNLETNLKIGKEGLLKTKDKAEAKAKVLQDKLEKRGIKITAVSRALDMVKRKKESREWANYIGTRCDIPHDLTVRADINDVRTDWLKTADGWPVKGKILQSDLSIGGISPAAYFFMMLGVFIPLIGAIPYIGKPIGLILAIIYSVMVGGMLGGLIGFLSFVAAFIGVMIGVYAMFLPALLPLLANSIIKKKRQKVIAKYAVETLGASSIYSDRNVARWQQAGNAWKDKTSFINLGTASGKFNESGDVMAPDAGQMFGLTLEDLTKHMLVLGSTGTGKTSGLLRPIILGIVQDERNNVLENDLLKLTLLKKELEAKYGIK